MDKWGGYDASRRRLTEFLVRQKPSNPVFITGDVHANFAMEVKANPDDPASATIAPELIGTSISSGGDGADSTPGGQSSLQANPNLKFFNGQRGYVRCTVTPQRLTSEFRVLPYVSRPGSSIETRATFHVDNGKPELLAQ
jgi:alkaline phosphatase D